MTIRYVCSRAAGTVAALAMVSLTGPAMAGAKIAVDDTHWVSVGAGLRTSFNAVEDAAPSGDDPSKDFKVDNMRLYIAGQIHEKIKFTFNTDIAGACSSCGDNAEIIVLDAIAQFELMPAFNIWAGRMLTPADRIEMNGPFYSLSWGNAQYASAPLYPSDQGDNVAGKFGRDNGVTFWGTASRFQYAVGLFDGFNAKSENSPNQDDNLLLAARFAYNFLNMEQNPGYYTSSTYFGGLGDIFTLGFVVQAQKDGVGNADNAEDFTGYAIDLLWENVLAGASVLTIEGEFKYFDAGVSDDVRFGGPENSCAGFCMFDGNAWFGTVAWLFPQEVGIGKFQPYLRYSRNNPDDYSESNDETELGLNYIIKGHDAKLNISVYRGDTAPFSNGQALDDDISALVLGAQVQI